MKVFGISYFINLLLALQVGIAGLAGAQRDNGRTDLVQWDRSSLYINGERVYIFSGEFHYPRLPVPELWLDIFQKLRATGFNAVSIYFFWAYHSPNPETYDFETGAHDIQRLFDYAKEAGIWIITRSGPYINAETTAGGIALWCTAGGCGVPRTHDEAYHKAWLPWVTKVGQVFARNSVVEGGVAILNQHENEFIEAYHDPAWTGVKYMVQIDEAFKNAGVVVPSTHNEKGMRGQSWSKDYLDVGGSVDIYGLDSYPNGFNCANPTKGFNVVKTYYSWFESYSPTQPSYIPEYQGGAFDPWGGYSYDNCALLTGTEFTDVFYKTLVAQKVSLINLYMTYGGTNWGSVAAPVVYSSYDYGAPLTEARVIRDKMRQIKSLTLFLRASEDLRNTVQVRNGTDYTNVTSIFALHLKNPDTAAGFYWINQQTSSSTAVIPFSLNVETSVGNVTIPNVRLDGRESKIVVTDYKFGQETLLFSSAEVLTYAIVDKKPTLVLYINAGQTANLALKGVKGKPTVYGDVEVTTSTFKDNHTLLTYTQTSGRTVVEFKSGPQIWLVDRITGWNIWAPSLTSSPNTKPHEHLLVTGPYLVRTAELKGSTLELTGDLNSTTTVDITAPAPIRHLTWNGKSVSGVSRTKYNTLTAKLAGPDVQKVLSSLPDLTKLKWKSSDSLVERLPSYNDNSWTLANKTTTLNPRKPETLPILYPDDYGYHGGIKLYRGKFTIAKNATAPTSAKITAIGGDGFGFSIFLNGEFLVSHTGSPLNASATLIASFASSTLFEDGKENVLLVVLDYMGHDQESVGPYGPRNPRGISHASLDSGSFAEWRLVGNAGGESNLDPVRGVYNEGGLRSDRLGWHLPSFPTTSSSSTKWSTTTSLSVPTAGVTFFRATFSLNLPATYDVPLQLIFTPPSPSSSPARITIYINGYAYGKYIPHIGPQYKFPIPPGIINNRGENTIGLSVWAMTGQGVEIGEVKILPVEASGGVFDSGFSVQGKGIKGGFAFDAKYLQPKWKKGEREKFA